LFGGRASTPAQGGPGWVGPADVARANSIYGTAAAGHFLARVMDPKEAELDRKARELAGNMHREQDAAKKATLKIELHTVVAQQFQMRQQRRMEDLTRLEDEVKKLRDAMEKREKSKDAIISKRVSELTGEDDIGF
jgi:membrane carboxypeptidase/penicillin-binding protein PbpC